jgi:REP element-mobilizing transposase RayT
VAWFHVWFSTKGRRAVLGDDIRELVFATFRDTADAHSINLIESAAEEDHAHLLLQVGPGQTLASVMQQLKGASSRRVLTSFPELRWDMKTFWQKSYGHREVTEDQIATVHHYIATQSERPLRH